MRLNHYFDVFRDGTYLMIKYVGITILEVDLKYKAYITNYYYNMFPRINYFLRKAVAKLDTHGYKDIDKVRILYDTSKYRVEEKNGKQILVRNVPETVLVG